MDQFKAFIKSIVSIDDTELEQIVSQFKERTLKKEKLVLRQGQIASAYYFVQKGGLRIYLDANDRQITGWVALENDFFAELSSLKSQTPCRFNIQAIEHTVLLTISKTRMEGLYKKFPV
jgi:CRP-like cAMP-binding protein